MPTSPMSGTFGADLEQQRRRLEEAGLGLASVVRAPLDTGVMDQ